MNTKIEPIIKSSIFDQEILTACPNPKGGEQIDHETGELVYVPHQRWDYDGNVTNYGCGSNYCHECRIINARKAVHAVALAEPSHAFGLSLVGDDFWEITRRMTDFAYYGRQIDPLLRIVWAAEYFPSGNGTHVHGYLHGSNDRRALREVFDYAPRRAGMGRQTYYDEVPDDVEDEYFQYMLKALADEIEAERFLELNCGKRIQLVHASDGFWRDGPGGRILTRKEAEQIAFRRARAARARLGRSA